MAHPPLPRPQYYDLRLIPLEQFIPELSLGFCGCRTLRVALGGEGGIGFALRSESENLRKENFKFAAAEARSKRDPSTAVGMTGG